MSENMLNSKEEKRLALVAQVEKGVKELCEVIEKDIVTYALKAVRKLFIDDLSFAESKSDAELMLFKERLHQFIETLAAKSSQRLGEDLELWIGENITLSEGKTLEANVGLWKILTEISPSIERFIKDEGLKGEIPAYKTPMYFIDGKFAPGMIEKYWANLAALRILDQEIAQTKDNLRKEKQSQRWDEI